MSTNSKRDFSKFYNFLALLVAAITLYFQIRPIQKEYTTQSLVILGIIFSVIIFYVVYSYISNIIKEKFNQIDFNTEKIKEIERKINIEKRFFELEKRILLIEEKTNNKKMRRNVKKR